MSAARRSSVVRTATVTPPEDMDTVLIHDTECAMVKCDTASYTGTLVVTRSEMSFEPEMDEGDLESQSSTLSVIGDGLWPNFGAFIFDPFA